jgi:hypothetical protein
VQGMHYDDKFVIQINCFSFKNNHLIKKRLNKVAQETKANSAIAIPIIEGDEVGFRFIPIIDSIIY